MFIFVNVATIATLVMPHFKGDRACQHETLLEKALIRYFLSHL